jgi:hypothetical protein
MKEKEDKMSLDNDIYHHIDVTVQMTRKKKTFPERRGRVSKYLNK